MYVALLRSALAPTPLPEGLQDWLKDLPCQTVSFGGGENVLSEGEIVTGVHVLLEGWACRYVKTTGGRRQIVDFVLPGEPCSPWFGGTMRFGVRALSKAKVALLNRSMVLESIDQRSALIGRLILSFAEEHTRLGSWLLNIGQRRVPERVGYLLHDLATRI